MPPKSNMLEQISLLDLSDKVDSDDNVPVPKPVATVTTTKKQQQESIGDKDAEEAVFVVQERTTKEMPAQSVNQKETPIHGRKQSTLDNSLLEFTHLPSWVLDEGILKIKFADSWVSCV